MTDARFEGRVALVTGASRGIGFAIARRLVDEGARVCLTARKPEPLAEAVESLGGSDHAIGIAGKADDADHQGDAVEQTIEAYGRLDHLVNNTGINPAYGPMIDLDLGAAAKIFQVNVLAALAWTQQAYARWMREHGGSVVNVASVAGLKPAPGMGAYGASKRALLHVTEELGVELAPGVRVNSVAPAVVKTDFAKLLYEGKEADVSAGYPMRRLGDPGDIASAVAFLLSDDASWITGQNIVLDGGMTLTGGV
ncbi:SDR family oxidoreductase [Solicola gregarius]|uniref:SDR family oxidoreductase n=1 Tax=Solicola gregarius TaxID=2908642 RepID=A0AA46YK61_9ACTN|nr:SDR family oxidoreductase [Solicola gregarius]UYM04259.1 SDR family oxidoreductase [Solicola gregarius]